MKDFSNIWSYLTGTVFGQFFAKAASGQGAKDGTEWTTKGIDTIALSWIQSLFTRLGLTPNTRDEAPTDSQVEAALEIMSSILKESDSRVVLSGETDEQTIGQTVGGQYVSEAFRFAMNGWKDNLTDIPVWTAGTYPFNIFVRHKGHVWLPDTLSTSTEPSFDDPASRWVAVASFDEIKRMATGNEAPHFGGFIELNDPRSGSHKDIYRVGIFADPENTPAGEGTTNKYYEAWWINLNGTVHVDGTPVQEALQYCKYRDKISTAGSGNVSLRDYRAAYKRSVDETGGNTADVGVEDPYAMEDHKHISPTIGGPGVTGFDYTVSTYNGLTGNTVSTLTALFTKEASHIDAGYVPASTSDETKGTNFGVGCFGAICIAPAGDIVLP